MEDMQGAMRTGFLSRLCPVHMMSANVAVMPKTDSLKEPLEKLNFMIYNGYTVIM